MRKVLARINQEEVLVFWSTVIPEAKLELDDSYFYILKQLIIT